MVLNLPFQLRILTKTSTGILILFSHAKNEVTDLRGRTRMMELVSSNGFAREGYLFAGFLIPFAGLDEKGIPVRYKWKYNIVLILISRNAKILVS